MDDGITFDTTDLELWSVQITRASVQMWKNIPKALEVNARHVKEDARSSVRSAFGHIPALPFSINYDVSTTPTGFEYEVGYDHDKSQGVLGHIIEYGGATGYRAPNAPQRNLAKALAKNEEDLMTGLRKAVFSGLDFGNT